MPCRGTIEAKLLHPIEHLGNMGKSVRVHGGVGIRVLDLNSWPGNSWLNGLLLLLGLLRFNPRFTDGSLNRFRRKDWRYVI